MITLFDTYGQSSWDLHYSLLLAGYKHPTVCLTDDGFLPDDVTSPYQFFTEFKDGGQKPLYFNQVELPNFWEIVGNGSQAEIFDLHRKRGHIHYASPSHKRHVKMVDWYDEEGRMRLTDRYNRLGYRFGQTVYDREGQPLLTSYFNQEGHEVVQENHQTGSFMLHYQEQVHFFGDKREWVDFYLTKAGFQRDRIFYNTLSLPFLTCFYMEEEGQDILFWQEPIQGEIPGNMRLLLNGAGKRPTKIAVQDATAYKNLLPLLTETEKEQVYFLGFQYPFVKQNQAGNQALILTNTDQLLHLKELVEALPDLHFHIGALTEMSSQLMAFSSYKNISLYPNISLEQVHKLYKVCDYYLDINLGDEILSSVRTAFEHNQLIYAFEETVHGRKYCADETIFSSQNWSQLVESLSSCLKQASAVAETVDRQKRAAHLASAEDYQAVIG